MSLVQLLQPGGGLHLDHPQSEGGGQLQYSSFELPADERAMVAGFCSQGREQCNLVWFPPSSGLSKSLKRNVYHLRNRAHWTTSPEAKFVKNNKYNYISNIRCI